MSEVLTPPRVEQSVKPYNNLDTVARMCLESVNLLAGRPQARINLGELRESMLAGVLENPENPYTDQDFGQFVDFCTTVANSTEPFLRVRSNRPGEYIGTVGRFIGREPECRLSSAWEDKLPLTNYLYASVAVPSLVTFKPVVLGGGTDRLFVPMERGSHGQKLQHVTLATFGRQIHSGDVYRTSSPLDPSDYVRSNEMRLPNSLEDLGLIVGTDDIQAFVARFTPANEQAANAFALARHLGDLEIASEQLDEVRAKQLYVAGLYRNQEPFPDAREI